MLKPVSTCSNNHPAPIEPQTWSFRSSNDSNNAVFANILEPIQSSWSRLLPAASWCCLCTVQSPHKSHTSNMPSFALVQDYRHVSYICPKKQTLPTPMFCTANFALICNTGRERCRVRMLLYAFVAHLSTTPTMRTNYTISSAIF